MANWTATAQAAYEVYCTVARSKQVSVLSVPDWEELPPVLQEAWREAAKEAVRKSAECLEK